MADVVIDIRVGSLQLTISDGKIAIAELQPLAAAAVPANGAINEHVASPPKPPPQRTCITKPIWREAEIAQLKDLWPTHPARVIAKRLGAVLAASEAKPYV